jgi:hypothetical protein
MLHQQALIVLLVKKGRNKLGERANEALLRNEKNSCPLLKGYEEVETTPPL